MLFFAFIIFTLFNHVKCFFIKDQDLYDCYKTFWKKFHMFQRFYILSFKEIFCCQVLMFCFYADLKWFFYIGVLCISMHLCAYLVWCVVSGSFSVTLINHSTVLQSTVRFFFLLVNYSVVSYQAEHMIFKLSTGCCFPILS